MFYLKGFLKGHSAKAADLKAVSTLAARATNLLAMSCAGGHTGPTEDVLALAVQCFVAIRDKIKLSSRSPPEALVLQAAITLLRIGAHAKCVRVCEQGLHSSGAALSSTEKENSQDLQSLRTPEQAAIMLRLAQLHTKAAAAMDGLGIIEVRLTAEAALLNGRTPGMQRLTAVLL